MDKNLPRVFASPIDKEIHNNKDVFYGNTMQNRSVIEENIPKKINEIFASRNHVYKSRVKITTLTDEFEAVIVGKSGNMLLTLNGEKISIGDIKRIEKM